MIKYKSPFGIVITTGDAGRTDPKKAPLTTDDLERGPDGTYRLRKKGETNEKPGKS